MRFIALSAIATSVDSLNSKLLKQTKTLMIYNTLQQVRGSNLIMAAPNFTYKAWLTLIQTEVQTKESKTPLPW